MPFAEDTLPALGTASPGAPRTPNPLSPRTGEAGSPPLAQGSPLERRRHVTASAGTSAWPGPQTEALPDLPIQSCWTGVLSAKTLGKTLPCQGLQRRPARGWEASSAGCGRQARPQCARPLPPHTIFNSQHCPPQLVPHQPTPQG